MKRNKLIPLVTALAITALSSCKKDVLETNEITVTGNYQSLGDFYEHHETDTQAFLIDPNENTVITGDNGTNIGIPPNSLVDDNGNPPPPGDVKVVLREIFDIRSMVLSHRPTASNGTILHSRGMIYLEFSSNNIFYKPDTALGAFILTPSPIPGMKIYYGEPDPDFGINWTEDSSSIVIDTVAAYAFSFDSIGYGWLNIAQSYFMGTPTDITITPVVDAERDETVDLAVYLLFPSVNSVLNVSNTTNPQSVTAYDIPVGMQAVVAVVGVGRITNKAYFGKMNFTVTSPQSIDLNVVQMTDEQIYDSLGNL